MEPGAQARPSERAIVAAVAAVQFVNVLDFMIVMPLGPDFATDLGMPVSQLGLVGGSYTAAAAVSGLLGSLFLDRLDRRRALVLALVGLAAGTALGSLASSLETLIAARVVAGLFGGPATAVALAIIADTVPPQRRGRAVGTVMSAFSVASVLGVPAGLELARLGSWRLSLLAVAGLVAAVAAATRLVLPSLRAHLHGDGGQPRTTPWALMARPVVAFSMAMAVVVMMSMFVLVPNIAAYVQGNLGFPRADLGMLYLAGGAASYLAMRLAGPAVDRSGAFWVGAGGSVAVALVVLVGFVTVPPGLSPYFIFVGLMTASSFRMVAYTALTSRVPQPHERASFMSLQSAVQHGAAAAGAILSSLVLVALPGGGLQGMAELGLLAIGLGLLFPVGLWLVQRRVMSQELPLSAPELVVTAEPPFALVGPEV